ISDGSPPPCARPATRSGPPAANSVAILFFDARDTADAYLAEGLTEDLTSLLGSVARVQVKSPGVVRRAQRASPGDAPAIARALGVRYLVDGNVRRVGTRIRVSTRLVNGATAVAAWGDVFDRTPDERLDSGFAAAIGRAAYAHAIARGNYYRLPDAPIESLAVRGLVVADRALRRDSTSSDAWMARGYLVAFAYPLTMEGSVAAFQRS